MTRWVRAFLPALAVVVFAASASADTNVSGTISTNTTWTLAGSPYIVTGPVTVEGTPTTTTILTIQAGVTVKFNQNTYLQIGNSYSSTLQAVGASGSPITFTANTLSPTAGYWTGIKLMAPATSTSQISYATVSYAGSTNNFGGIYVNGSSPTISNVTVTNNAQAGITISGGSPTISNSTISSNPVGIYTSSGTPSFQTLTVSNNTGFAVSQAAGQTLGTVTGLTLTGNGTNAVELRGGSVQVNATWQNVGNPYVVTTGPVIFQGTSTTTAVLTIQAGATVKFDQNMYLELGTTYATTLQAVGTSTSPIVFTANGSTSPGYWPGLKMMSHLTSTSQLSYATVSYAGSTNNFGGIYVNGSSPTISNVTVTNNAQAGITISGGSPTISNSTISSNPVGIYTSSGTPSLQTLTVSGNTGFAVSQAAGQTLGTVTGLTLTGNGTNAVELRGGLYQANATWKNVGNPYVVTTNNVTFDGTSTTTTVLTIQAGVTVKFNQNYYLQIGSSYPTNLQAVGTSSSPITFTANTATPSAGYWLGIKFYPTTTSTSQLAYATVSYGGSTNNSGGIYVNGSSPTISNVTAINNAYAGISISNGSPTISFATLSSNPIGVRASGGAAVVVNSNFVGNTSGVVNAVPSSPITAQLNYWGSSTGPSGSGPGSGQSVSTGTVFEPWLTALPNAADYVGSSAIMNRKFNPTTSSRGSWTLTSAPSGNWTLTISNSVGTVVRTMTGSGTPIILNWDGKNDSGTLQPDGKYGYQIQTIAGGQSATPAIGSSFLDSTLQVAITAPGATQTLSNVYQSGATNVAVTGTVTMASFSSWLLDYGSGSAPSSWTTLASGTQQVSNSTLGTLATLGLLNGLYTVRLTASDSVGNSFKVVVTPTVANFTMSQSADNLNLIGGSVTYSSIVPFALTETVTLKNLAGQTAKTLVNSVPRAAGTYNDAWTGLGDSGVRVPDGAYRVSASVTDGTHTMSWDQSTVFWTTGDGNLHATLSSPFDPFNNHPLILTYSLTQAARVTLLIAQSTSGPFPFSCAAPGYCLIQDQYQAPGSHSTTWAETDSTGALRGDLVVAGLQVLRTNVSVNTVVVFGGVPVISNVAVTPTAYSPSLGQQVVGFDLATFQSQQASATVTWQSQDSLAVLRTITATGLSAGHNTIAWDGYADGGGLMPPGNYTVTVSVTDSIGNQAQGQILTTVQY